MKKLTTYCAAALIAFGPAARAEEHDWSEFERLLEQFSEESQEFLQDWLTQLTPLLEGLRDRVDDLSNYEAPEVLPNGDIIIRRKPDAPESPAPDPDDTPLAHPNQQIEL
jgi:hypothetical protein